MSRTILPAHPGSWRRIRTAPSSPDAAHEQSTPDLSIPRYFRKLKDPRRHHRRRHRRQDILIIALCATIAGAQDWQEIETFGRKRTDWLRRFLPLPHGNPSHDTFARVFDRLRPQTFQACCREWVQAVGAARRIRHVASDGKTWRGCGSAKLGPLHLVSAWATAQRLSLGPVAVDAQSNDITAMPALLELLELHGARLTIDARGCQKESARTLVERGGHDALTVKDNQEHLLDDIQRTFAQAFDTDFAGMDHDTYETRGRGHGRQE